jgi:Flp pilus assembly protein TadG
MKTTHAHSERGQVLVIIAIAMIALVGIASLAIDGSRAYTDRRHAQNAADTAALAAALARVRSDASWANVGLSRATSNGYNNDGVTNVVEIYNPPISGVYAGNVEYVQVLITSHVQTMMGGVVGIETVTNTVQTVVRVSPPVNTEMFLGEAVVGLSPHDCKAIVYNGNANTTVTGGGIFVNSDCSTSAFFNNSASASLTAPSLTAVGGVAYKPGALNVPSIVTGASAYAYPPRELVLPNITCSGNATKTGSTLSPGNVSGSFPPGGVTTLESGVYCISGDFRLNAHDTLVGHDVVIYMVSGEIRWNGGATVQLDAPDSGPYKGLLIYMPPDNPGPIILNGNSSSFYTGTILAPGADISVLGTGASSGLHSQVIGYTVDLTGNADITIHYDDGENWDAPTPPAIELIH